MSTVPFPHRHEESQPPRRMFVVGKHDADGTITYSSRRRIRQDVGPDPDTLPSDRIVPDPITDVEFPTGPALTASLIHGALKQLLETDTPLDQVAQVIAGAIRLEAERIAERERDKVLVVVRQLADTVQVLVEALERHHTDSPNEVA